MQLVNYLFFRNQADEAFAFYARCLDGRIALRVANGEMPGGDRMPAAMQALVAHIRLETDGAVLMASDWCPPAGDQPYPGIHGNAVSLTVATPAEAERRFAALAEGGTVSMPIGETSWAQRFGMLVDRYGVHWMVNCNHPEAGHG